MSRDAGGHLLAGLVLRDDAHALGRARADLDQRAAASRVFSGVARGSARLQPGTPLEIRGTDPDHAGSFVITSATHRIDTVNGYVTTVATHPPDRPEALAASTLTLGVVVDVDDPERLARIRVSLSALEDLETDWLSVVSPGAGPGKGIVATPDVGDRVAVLVPPDDPGLGVVLGGLFAREEPPEPGVVGGRVQRCSVVTAGGLRVVLSDDEQTMRLEDAVGSHVQLGPDGVELLAARPLDLAAPGQPVRIRGARIDFERA